MRYAVTAPHMDGTEQIRGQVGANHVKLTATDDGFDEVGFVVGLSAGMEGVGWLRRLGAEAIRLADELERLQ